MAAMVNDVRWQILDSVSVEEARDLLSAARRTQFDRGQPVFTAGDVGDGLYLLESSKVAVRVSTPAGDVATLRILVAGDSFGELALISAARRSATIIALEKVAVRIIGRDHFAAVRAQHPGVDRILVTALAGEVRRLSDQVLAMTHTPGPRRLAGCLLDLCDAYAVAPGPVTIALAQEDIAGLAGLTRPTTNLGHGGRARRGVDVRVRPHRPRGATIPSTGVRLYREDYVTLTTMSDGEFASQLPRDANGRCIAADCTGPATAVPVTVTVVNATLAGTSTSDSAFFLSLGAVAPGSQYGSEYAKYAELGLDERISVVSNNPLGASDLSRYVQPLLKGTDQTGKFTGADLTCQSAHLVGAALTDFPRKPGWDASTYAAYKNFFTAAGQTSKAWLHCDEVQPDICASQYAAATAASAWTRGQGRLIGGPAGLGR